MAKASNTPKKKVSGAPKKAAAVKKSSASSLAVDIVNEQALSVLQKLKADDQLCSEIQWCLGSYRHDGNNSGLLQTAQKALKVLTEEKNKNAKAVTVKLLSDLQKVVK